ncbi:MAG: hypothetical protein WCV85_00110 [Patescibacteria group bacterium]
MYYASNVNELIRDFPWLWFVIAADQRGKFNPSAAQIQVRDLRLKHWAYTDFCQNFLDNTYFSPKVYWLHCIHQTSKEQTEEAVIQIPVDGRERTQSFATHIVAGIYKHLQLPNPQNVKESSIPENFSVAHICIDFGLNDLQGKVLKIYRLSEAVINQAVSFNDTLLNMLHA